MTEFAAVLGEFITKAAGPFRVGLTSLGVTWAAFKGIESLLTDDTKLAIAVWLLDRQKTSAQAAARLEGLPNTFASIFDRVFGKRHLTWACFFKSALASYLAVVLSLLLWIVGGGKPDLRVPFNARGSGDFPQIVHFNITIPLTTAILYYSVLLNALPDYLSLLVTRRILDFARHRATVTRLAVCFLVDLYFTALIAQGAVLIGSLLVVRSVWGGPQPTVRELFGVLDPTNVIAHILAKPVEMPSGGAAYWYFPAFLTSIWLWLYAGSGFLLIAARRFDIGFEWFNSKLDIEKKPLSALGLVAGLLSAITYWIGAAIVWRVR